MKINEDIIKSLDLEQPVQKEIVSAMKCTDVLALLNKITQRMIDKSKLYSEKNNVDIQLDCMDIVTAKLNDFLQIFCDLVIFMREQEKTYNGSASLRYCVTSYDTFEFKQSEKEESFLKELLLRNEITHDYFNMEIHQQKLISIIVK